MPVTPARKNPHMNPRLLILIALAAGLAIFMAMRPVAPAAQTVTEGPTFESNPEGDSVEETRALQTPLWDRELPGEDPPAEPDIEVTVEVDTSNGKNRLVYFVTEAHGYYVEGFAIEFYFLPDPGVEELDEPLLTQRINDLLEANSTLRGCLEVVPAELARVGGSIGTSENWDALVTWHGRARVQDPDPLPKVYMPNKCR